MKKIYKIGLLFILSFNSLNAQIPSQQREALLSLFALDGSSWKDKTGWGGDIGTECQWFGITCDESEQNIIEIHLKNNDLIGGLNNNIDQLTHLKILDLSNNSKPFSKFSSTSNAGTTGYDGLTGNIPNLNNLSTTLVELRLNDNQFEGPIPNLSQLTLLKKINLSHNKLTVLDNLPSSLIELKIAYNKLEKMAPDALSNLPSLETLNLNFNKLKEIPDFSTLSNLKYLNLSSNSFEIKQLNQFNLFPNTLTTLELVGAQLESIPNISYFKQLESLSLGSNRLTVIEGLNELTLLTTLNLNNNRFQSFPAIFELSKLTRLDLRYNKLSGTIPELTNLINLEVLTLIGNKLSGEIPELNHLLNLTELDLSDNKLTGTIPALDKLDNLKKLSFRQNQLTGQLPLLSPLPVFSNLDLSNNFLSGTLKHLEDINTDERSVINLSHNNLSGFLTPLLTIKASYVYLSYNQLEGIITTRLADQFLLEIQQNKCLTPENNEVRSLLSGHSNISNWDTQDCSAPIAYLDNIHSFFNNKSFLIDVSTNDVQGGLIDKESVDLEPDLVGQQKTKLVENQGIWEVIGEKIKFTPLDNFHQDPDPIEYTIKHKTTDLISQRTPLTIDYPPIATNDEAFNISIFGEIRINIIENDDTGDLINPNTIDLDLLQKGIQSTLVIDNEGFWQVNELGIMTFTPVPNLNKNPHSISYTIQDHEGNISNLAVVRVSYQDFSTELLNNTNNAFINENKQLIIPIILVDHRYYSATLEEIIHQEQSFWKLVNLTQLNLENSVISNNFNPSNFNLSLTLNTHEKITLNYQFFDKVSQTFYWKRADNTDFSVAPVNIQENPNCLADNTQISWSESTGANIDVLHIPAISLNQKYFSITLEKMDNLQEPNHPFWKLNLPDIPNLVITDYFKLLEQASDTSCNQVDPNTLDIELFRTFYKDINGSRIELNHQSLKFLLFDEKTNSFYWRG